MPLKNKSRLTRTTKIRRRRRMAAVAVFDPLTITGLTLWLKADAIVGLNDADPISTWTSSDANAFAFTQAAGNRPTYKTNILGGKPVARFAAASSQSMSCATAGIKNFHTGADIPYTAFIVGYTAGTQQGFFSWGLSTGSQPYVVWRKDPSSKFGVRRVDDAAGAVEATSTTSLSNTTPQVLTISFPGTTTSTWINGTIENNATSTDNGTFSSANITAAYIGAWQVSGLTGFVDGDIAEILLYNSALSATDRDAVESYLGTKYGITVA